VGPEKKYLMSEWGFDTGVGAKAEKGQREKRGNWPACVSPNGGRHRKNVIRAPSVREL